MKKNLLNVFLIFVFIELLQNVDLRHDAVYAEELTTVDQALRENFKTATAIEKNEFHPAKDLSEIIPIYIIKKDQQTIGYALEHTVKGKWGPIHHLLVLNPQGKIQNIHILSYEEKRGRPIAKPRFTRQFIGKSIHNPVRLKKDIQGVTGATISSRGITDGVRKLLAVFEEFRKL